MGRVRMSRHWRLAVAALVGAMVAPIPVGMAEAGPSACDNRNNNTIAKLLECVTLAGVREHQQALQHDRERQRGQPVLRLPGHDQSPWTTSLADSGPLGYNPTVQPFDYFAFAELGPSALAADGTGQRDLRPRRRLRSDRPVRPWRRDRRGHRRGPAARHRQHLDQRLRGRRTSPASRPGTSRCSSAGTCTFELKAENAAAAGAVGIVIFNQGNTVTLTARASRRSPSRPTTPVASRCSARPTRWERPGEHTRPADAGVRQHGPRDQDDLQRAGRDLVRQRQQRRHGRRPPRLRRRGSRHQRQRLRQRGDPRGRRADAEGEADQQGPLRLVGRRGVGPGRLDVLRRQPSAGRTGPRSPST